MLPRNESLLVKLEQSVNDFCWCFRSLDYAEGMAINSITQVTYNFDNSAVPGLLPGFSAAQARLNPGQSPTGVGGFVNPTRQFDTLLARTGQILSDLLSPPKPALSPEVAEKIANFTPEEKVAFERFCKTSQEITDKGRAEGKSQQQIDQDIVNVLNLAAQMDKNKETAVEDGKLRSPLDRGSFTVSQEEKEGAHPGIDLAAAGGTPIHAAGVGKVIKANPNSDGSGYGNYVVIDHGNGLQTLYGHMQDAPSVKQGDMVTKGP